MFARLLTGLKALAGTRLEIRVLPDGGHFTVTSFGLREAGLPEVEIIGCPARLCEVASNLVSQIATNGLKEPASLASGKIIGSRFVSSDQPLLEVLRLTKVETQLPTLRVVDLQDDAQGFPHRLVATHLCASAGMSRRDSLRLLLVSVEVWPKEKMASNAALADFELNPNNFWAWIDLGTALAHANQTDNAIVHWKTAVCMWPRGGKLYASKMLSKSQPDPGWNGNAFSHHFWASVSNDNIRTWSAQLDVEVKDDTLNP